MQLSRASTRPWSPDTPSRPACRPSMAVLTFRRRSAFGAVLDLPGVVEDVPGDPPRRVPGQPALLAEPLRACRRPEHLEDLRAPDGVGDLLAGGRAGHAELADVARLGVHHVGADLVAVAPAASRALAQLGGS